MGWLRQHAHLNATGSPSKSTHSTEATPWAAARESSACVCVCVCALGGGGACARERAAARWRGRGGCAARPPACVPPRPPTHTPPLRHTHARTPRCSRSQESAPAALPQGGGGRGARPAAGGRRRGRLARARGPAQRVGGGVVGARWGRGVEGSPPSHPLTKLAPPPTHSPSSPPLLPTHHAHPPTHHTHPPTKLHPPRAARFPAPPGSAAPPAQSRRWPPPSARHTCCKQVCVWGGGVRAGGGLTAS